MPHLVATIRNVEITDALGEILQVIECMSAAARATCAVLATTEDAQWGAFAKRSHVIFPDSRPISIEKPSEVLVEVINMIATLERMHQGLLLLLARFPCARVVVLHPSTSSSGEGRSETDIVLRDGDTTILVEVCDIVGSDPGQNGKEKKTLQALRVGSEPQALRFIATSRSWAGGLMAANRRVPRELGIEYQNAGVHGDTVLVAVLYASAPREEPPMPDPDGAKVFNPGAVLPRFP